MPRLLVTYFPKSIAEAELEFKEQVVPEQSVHC